ncbi:hypothetical protein P43SY_003526 [Pythium insidiosum]|uniref:AAA+ ATPase domain-containing protein n=1 Tax=Pythium insidiosum TaxID=114742 RepID=A0AAD5M2D8_PYTIN|nr:hypothetical protein P43SY_003526 [Pythium insidiosum]
MRRHFVFKEQEHEHSVGDQSGRNLLQLWLARRLDIQRDELVARHLVSFWDLAKGPRSALALSKPRYAAFFQCVAKALVQSVGNPAAVAMAPRDWLYDCRWGSPDDADPDGEATLMALEEFQDALFEVAELVLPVESDASMFSSFFHELRDAIARRPSTAVPVTGDPSFASDWDLRPLREVVKIRGAFLQAMAPNRDHLAIISGLSSPDSEAMSLKQVLLAYNPRKLALSRQFSAVVASAAASAVATQPATRDRHESTKLESTRATSWALNRLSDDAWDPEAAAVEALSTFPALRVAVVGPPGSGKTRVARALATRLELQYVSLSSAIGDAIERKRDRDQARAQRLQERNAAMEAAAAAAQESGAAEQAADAGGESPPPELPTEAATVEVEEPKDPEDLLFGDDDLATLRQGGSLSHAKALTLLVAHARRLLLRGIGVVIDDVHPSQVNGELGVDYVIVLEIGREDARERVASLRLAPTVRRVYSQRELAMLEACDAVLEDRGWADRPRVEREASERQAEDARHTSNASPPGEDIDGDAAAAAEGDAPPESDPDEAQVPQTARELSVLERNDVEPLSEATVPLGSLLLDAFSDRFKDFDVRVASASVPDPTRTHVIRVAATQALSAVVQHCVHGITNSSLGLSRAAWSHQAVAVPLPEDIGTESRAEQLRWLLFGDWTAVQDAWRQAAFRCAPLGAWRQLSRWEQCCPVTYAATGTTTVGDPQYAALFRARVYLLATAASREAFCAHPLQYLRLHPPAHSCPPSLRRLWLLSSVSMHDGPRSDVAHALAEAVDGPAALWVSATALVASRSDLMDRSQSVLPVADAARAVAEALRARSSWLLTDLPATTETLQALAEQDALPDAVILLVVKPPDDADGSAKTTALSSWLSTPLDHARHAAFVTRYGADGSSLSELLAATLSPRTPPQVVSCALPAQARDAQAALLRAINPLAPRVDSVDSGTMATTGESETATGLFSRDSAATELALAAVSPPPDATTDSESDGDATPRPIDLAPRDDEQGVALEPLSAEQRVTMWGETAQFCAVSWCSRRQLVPGLAQHVASFRQRWYAFAGPEERMAFERDPVRYIPCAPRATRDAVPLVLLLPLGVGAAEELAELAREIAASVSDRRVAVVDFATVEARVQSRQLATTLQPPERRPSIPQLFVDELEREVTQLSSRFDAVVLPGIVAPRPHALVGSEDDDPPAEPSAGVPSTELLSSVLDRRIFPTLVVPTTTREDVAIQRQLDRWRASQPPLRRWRRRHRRGRREIPAAEGDDGAGEPEDPSEEAETRASEERQRLEDRYKSEKEGFQAALQALEARGVMVATPVRLESTRRATLKRLRTALARFLTRAESLFDYTARVSADELRSLLRAGQVSIGKHGLRCPLTGASPSVQAPLVALRFRDRLYFPSPQSIQALECSPWRLRDPASPSHPPVHRPTCAIVGGPASWRRGETRRLAETLASAADLVYVSPERAVDWVLQCLGGTELWRQLHAVAAAHAHPPIELVHAAVTARLRAADCVCRGWVLEGYLLSHEQLARCLDGSVQPALLFILERPDEPLGDALAADDTTLLKAAQWPSLRLDLLRVWISRFGPFHTRQLDASAMSSWQLSTTCRAVLAEHVACTRRYEQDTALLDPTTRVATARVHGVLLDHDALTQRQHPVWRTFCPVELAAGRYVASSPHDRGRCVEVVARCSGDDDPVKRAVFWLANERNLETFRREPLQFVSLLDDSPLRRQAAERLARAPIDPSILSLITVTDCDFPEMRGYCPVTFQSGTGDADWQAIVKGSIFYRASFDDHAFFLASERAKQRFLREPTRFADLQLPIKLPPQLTATSGILAKHCPGRIEQALAGVLNETLLALGHARPKFLGVRVDATACFYLALLLKTRTTSLPKHIQATYAERLRAFERDCRLGEELRVLLTPRSSATSCGPAVKGVRAVRDALPAPHSGAATPSLPPAEDALADVLGRFDRLSMGLGTSPNQREESDRQGDGSAQYFLDYSRSPFGSSGS